MNNIFKDKDGNTVITQTPNWEITLAFVFWILSLVTNGNAHTFFRFGFILFLSIWAIAEVVFGVNTFRRILGSIVLLYCIYTAISNL